MDNITKEAFDGAIKVLERCSTKNGFYAAFPGYDMVFARDSMIMSLGASLIGERFKEVIKRSLMTLAENQSKKGQIPNAVDLYSKRKKHIDYQSIDSTLWFLIGEKVFSEKYKDKSLMKKHKRNIEKALTWLSYQDICERGLLDELPTTDWEDAFPEKYGHAINEMSLYYKVLNLYGKKKHALNLKKIINKDKDKELWNKDYYYAWRWKNHGKYHERGDWFDSLGNVMAVVYDLADKKRAEKIINYIKKEKIDQPYPMKSIFPSIKRGSRYWKDYFDDCDARDEYHYLNAGIWTYIGGFYVCALVKMKKFNEAEKELEKLAKANMLKPKFSEWLDGRTGKPFSGKIGKKEGNQGWNAGMYLAAYESVKRRKCLI